MPASKWDDNFYAIAYEMARGGSSNDEIAAAINISPMLLNEWRKKRPALREAIRRGRRVLNGKLGGTLGEWVYGQLNPKIKKTWDKLVEFEHAKTPLEYVEAMLQKKGEGVRKRLLIQSIVASSFDMTKALRRVNVSRQQLKRWCEYDPEFAELLTELEWHKGNFFESALIRLVKRGDPGAVVFVNKTYNKKRGYGEKIEVEHSGQIASAGPTIDFDQIDISLKLRKQLYELIKSQVPNIEEGDE